MEPLKPANIEDYTHWLETQHGIRITERTRTYYGTVAATVRSRFFGSELWTTLCASLREYDGEYRVSTGGYVLLTSEAQPELFIKPFDSFLLKTFRRNILDNTRWPEAPDGGWILPEDWYSQINDVVRTMVSVKYLDGVEFLIDKVTAHCAGYGLACQTSLEAREEGYYAAHLTLRQEFEVPRPTWDTLRIPMKIEIQVTTQLQEVIRVLLHRHYERRRQLATDAGELKWQWDYRSDEFVANYLGHILHYVEGMIMNVRAKQQELRT